MSFQSSPIFKGYGLFLEDLIDSDPEKESDLKPAASHKTFEHSTSSNYTLSPNSFFPTIELSSSQLSADFINLEIGHQTNDLVITNTTFYNQKIEKENLQKLQTKIVSDLRTSQIKAIESEISSEIKTRKKITESFIKEHITANLCFQKPKTNFNEKKPLLSEASIDLDINKTIQKVNELKDKFKSKVQESELKKIQLEEQQNSILKQKNIELEKQNSIIKQKNIELEKQKQSQSNNCTLNYASNTLKADLSSSSNSFLENKNVLSTQDSAHNILTNKNLPIDFNCVEMSVLLAANLKKINNDIGPSIKTNSQHKNYCFDCKRKINLKIGQLTNDYNQIQQSTTSIISILNDAIKYDSNVYKWILNLTAKSLVSQAETEVAVQISVCYPLAHITVGILQSHPRLLKFLKIRLNKKCPYIYPRNITKNANESADDFKIRLCFRKSSQNNGFEPYFKYQERMCGMLAYYSAIIQTTPKGGLNPFPVYNGWIWLSKILNLPMIEIFPAIITTFIEIAGSTMQAAFKTQFSKLMTLLKSQYIVLSRKNLPSSASSISRLESVLEYYFTNSKKFELSCHRKPL
ncbi:hypothetical protein BB561_004387 [Smittium simulii]|uniref:mRNA export factor GLE1 n=1 Tax=Smittium simulii TaxID=133385 RepID=A0A2T9YGL6_9FUNG|nr:hypothetical protein BB561_004387 [Smittium simulii]